MRYRPLGQSGLLVSVVGLGCNNFGGRIDVDRTRSVVDAAIDVGITLFDTSDTYGGGGGSERALGEILGSRRDQVVLATKFGGRGVDMGYGPAAGAKGGPKELERMHGSRTLTVWYARDLKRAVKYESRLNSGERTPLDANFDFELVSYQLK